MLPFNAELALDAHQQSCRERGPCAGGDDKKDEAYKDLLEYFRGDDYAVHMIWASSRAPTSGSSTS